MLKLAVRMCGPVSTLHVLWLPVSSITRPAEGNSSKDLYATPHCDSASDSALADDQLSVPCEERMSHKALTIANLVNFVNTALGTNLRHHVRGTRLLRSDVISEL